MKKRIPIVFRVYLALCAFTFVAIFVGYGQTNPPVVVEAPQVVIPGVPAAQRQQLTFGLDQVPGLNNTVFDIPVWQYLATALYLMLAVVTARLLNYLVSVQLRKITARTKTRVDDLFVELLHGPVKVLAFVLLLHLGLNLFHWPNWLELWVKKGISLLLAFSLTYMALKIVDLGVKFWRTRSSVAGDKAFNDLLVPLIAKTLKGFFIIMAVLLTLDNLNFNIRTLLAGVSISGLALGLAAQDTVGNLFGAAAVFMDKPFKIGDRIQLNGIDGTVVEMGLRSTRVRNLDGHLITVPNKTMGNATITNVTMRPHIKTVLNFGLTYDTPAEKIAEASRILEQVYKGHQLTSDLIVGFNQFADSSLNISVIHFWKAFDHKEFVAAMQQMHLEVKRRFDEAKIGFAFPSRTVYLRQDNEWQVQLPAARQA